jgi:hypothetical protein
MSTHGSRPAAQQQNLGLPDFTYDVRLLESKESTDAALSVLEQVITEGAKILYMKYIMSQIRPYASRTLTRELIMNATWASIPLDSREIFAEEDEDLEIPPIDEWAGGVLPVRGSDTASLRCSVTPQREVKRATPVHRPRTTVEKEPEPRVTRAPERLIRARTAARPESQAAKPKKKKEVVLTEAQIIIKTFDEARKKSNVAMKSVTVDSDFSVIQITEPKGLPPALIIPKVTVKTKGGAGKPAVAPTVPRVTRTATKQEPKRRRPQVKLVEPDTPVFDEEVADISYSDRFVCVPGVTFKDGTVVKSRPPVVNPSQLTRSQYEAYLEDMKKNNSD